MILKYTQEHGDILDNPVKINKLGKSDTTEIIRNEQEFIYQCVLSNWESSSSNNDFLAAISWDLIQRLYHGCLLLAKMYLTTFLFLFLMN